MPLLPEIRHINEVYTPSVTMLKGFRFMMSIVYESSMAWRKCLYLQQEYPINYIEMQPMQKKRNVAEIHEDVNRIVIRISIIMLNFCLFRLMVSEDEVRMPRISWFSFISTFMESFLESKECVGMDLKPNFMLLTFGYLLSPLIRTLALEMSPAKVYVYFIMTQVVFAVDSVSASIYNTGCPVEIKDAQIPLALEESINVPKRIFSNHILGLTSYFLGFILLSSRLKEPSSVFDLLCLTFIGYILLPNYLEGLDIHKKSNIMILLYITVLIATFFPDATLFCIYSCTITSIYSISHISIWLLDNDLKRSTIRKLK